MKHLTHMTRTRKAVVTAALVVAAAAVTATPALARTTGTAPDTVRTTAADGPADVVTPDNLHIT
ncbi:hypothetical protein [Streptomyces sp. NBC_01014]|uniref:hypothetical protein n=1 Tax=Streptomyces sp. NBC_01014 TaxID=2903719 RepID=UPI00386D0CCE|nr:hypothetical protein OG282_19540 [Streptomyces sp. NBC_01014]